MLLAIASALLAFMQPVQHHSLGSCFGPCLHPAFPLHGYRFDNENRATRLPFARGDASRGPVVHISFTPPFTGICEVFEVVRANGRPAAQHIAERPVQPHVIHLELTLPTDDALLKAGEMPWTTTMVAVDCWHFGHESAVVYSRFYQLPKGPVS